MSGRSVANFPRNTKKKKQVIFLVGPTAVGKSRIAVSLAKKINAQIISCDSMQVYKGMNIITSKPDSKMLKAVKHYLVGTVPMDKEFNVSSYRKEALRALRKIIAADKIPLFVGGTGLYVSILIDGIFRVKAHNELLRKKLYSQAERLGSPVLHKKLQAVDPAAASKIHPNDARRIIRALEVFKLTGKPISELQKQRRGLINEYDVRVFCLNIPRQELYNAINKRVDNMFKKGLVIEANRLLKKKISKTASYAIGLGELKGYISGEYDLSHAKELIKHNTRLYAKRQLTWFRKDKRIEWMDIYGETAGQSVKNLIHRIQGGKA